MKSAQAIGRGLGLGAQEMNFALKEAGLQSGKPGAWSLTELGKKYAVDQSHHRGNGGYTHFNRYWETRHWDESVVGLLGDLTADRKRYLQETVAAARRASRAAGTQLAPAIASVASPPGPNGLALRTPGPVHLVAAGAAVFGLYIAGSMVNRRRRAAKNSLDLGGVAADAQAEPHESTEPIDAA